MAKRNKTENKQEKRKTFNKQSFGKFHGKTKSGIDKTGTSSSNPNRKIAEGSEGFYRTKATIKRLKMYTEKPDMMAMHKVPDKPARIEPDRRWFGNTRTIDQKNLENLRREVENKKHDTYSLLLKKKRIPMSLISPMEDIHKIKKSHDTFKDTFGKQSKRKKPNLKVFSMEEYADSSIKQAIGYDCKNDNDLFKDMEKEKIGPDGKFATAGMSKRIFSELYKVIDSSDVLCCVLDARDPMGTRSFYVENFIKKNAPHKHIIFILNKSDLIPTWATVN